MQNPQPTKTSSSTNHTRALTTPSDTEQRFSSAIYPYLDVPSKDRLYNLLPQPSGLRIAHDRASGRIAPTPSPALSPPSSASITAASFCKPPAQSRRTASPRPPRPSSFPPTKKSALQIVPPPGQRAITSMKIGSISSRPARTRSSKCSK